MRILKVKKRKPEGIVVEFEREIADGRKNKYTLDCVEAPAPELLLCFDALRRDVISLCELPDEEFKISVSGVSFSYGSEREVMGATIIAKRSLQNANCPMNLLTPHKASEPYAEGGHTDPKAVFEHDTTARLNRLLAETELYVGGKRQQADLFEGENAPSSP